MSPADCTRALAVILATASDEAALHDRNTNSQRFCAKVCPQGAKPIGSWVWLETNSATSVTTFSLRRFTPLYTPICGGDSWCSDGSSQLVSCSTCSRPLVRSPQDIGNCSRNWTSGTDWGMEKWSTWSGWGGSKGSGGEWWSKGSGWRSVWQTAANGSGGERWATESGWSWEWWTKRSGWSREWWTDGSGWVGTWWIQGNGEL